ncbi:hypothetical protein O9993_13990 [Vibrio lentus]|nr:hypothetical protein [Vibrio lentus]
MVAVGDAVLKSPTTGSLKDWFLLYVHAPTSGVITAIELNHSTLGLKATCASLQPSLMASTLGWQNFPV